VRIAFYALSMALLVACTATAPSVPQGKGMASIHEVEILVIADKRLLKLDVPEPDYNSAPDIMTGYRMKQEYQEKVAVALGPLQPELTSADTQGRLIALLQDQLAKAGIKVKGVRSQPYSGSAHDEREFEDRAASAPRGSPLLVWVPAAALSGDYRSLILSARVQVYPRDSDIAAMDKVFTARSAPLGGADPVTQWSAAGGELFFREFGAQGTALTGQIAASFSPSAP
jgi:hypothetical protein